MAKTALILGSTGKIGSHAIEAFTRAGWNVRAYDRKSNDMVAAAHGVDVIVNGLNPPKYHDWARLIPAITRQVIEAAKTSGATVILPGNVYNMGAVGGEWSEHTPHAPNTKKGAIREAMEQSYRASGVRTINLRVGNFIDPNGNGDVMSLLLLRSIKAGKITSAGDPKAMQAYGYVPDWARAAVALSEIRQQLDVYEDIPFAGHSFSVEQLRDLLSEQLQRPITVTQFPWLAMQLTAPFWELAREMLEMRYLWNVSHTLSADKLTRLLPNFHATPLREVITAALQAAGVSESELLPSAA